jgi:phage terminase large subunit-like protein
MAREADEPDDWLRRAKPYEIGGHVSGLKKIEREEYDYTFSNTAHAGQLPPEGEWRTWLVMAGRGFGKTRAGAEWVRAVAEADPEARIALVAASLQEARSVMVEGESGLLACCPPHGRPVFEPSLRRVRFANGALALLYGANEPEALRGPQHSHARGAVAERILRQRGACAGRYPAP